MLKKNLTALLGLFSVFFICAAAAAAQEAENAPASNLTGVALPADARRLLPGSVPAEVTQLFDKVIAAGNGKLRQGGSEVLVWGGDGYRQTAAPDIINRLTTTLKTAGWQYSVEGIEDGLTLFTAVKDGAPRRVVVGFHGANDGALLFSWMEVLPAEGSSDASRTDNDSRPATQQVEQNKPPRNSAVGGSIVGAWYDGYASMLVGYTPTWGPKSYTPGRSHYFKYVFHPNGAFEFTGLMQSTMYGCTTSWFNDKRGRYTIAGDQITLTPSKNFFRQHNSCAASGNKEVNHKLDPETSTLRIKRDEYGQELVCFNSGGEDACYKREEK